MKRANDKLHPCSLKKIVIMSKEEGIIFMCKETITNIFSSAQSSTTHSNRNKNTNPRHTEKRKCSVCRSVDVSGYYTCNKCSEKKPRLKYKPPAENHPRCQISHEKLDFSLPGYEKCKTIKIIYTIPGGIQKVSFTNILFYVTSPYLVRFFYCHFVISNRKYRRTYCCQLNNAI